LLISLSYTSYFYFLFIFQFFINSIKDLYTCIPHQIGRLKKMAAWGKWTALIGGVIAVIGQFLGVGIYLPLIGGVAAIVGALGSD
jgi:hypothetical protein